MFDSMIAADGTDWQTKAFCCMLEEWNIGDKVPGVGSFQVEVLGGEGPFVRSCATVRDGILTAVPDDRDGALPLVGYGGGLVEPANERLRP